MSPSVGSSSTASRAKCRRSNCPNGNTAFAGSAMPGAEFILSSSSRRPRSRPGATGANSTNWDCGVTALELQAEVDQPVLLPIHLAEIKARSDQPDLVAHPMGEE